ncbi:hypothetical protein Q5752_007021 [Cryptotrichosporon argae]
MAQDSPVIAPRRPTIFSRDSHHSLEENASSHSRDSVPAPGLSFPGLFGRRGSVAPAGMRPRTGESQYSLSSQHAAPVSRVEADAFEMTAVPQTRPKAEMARVDAIKTGHDESLAKWRKWAVAEGSLSGADASPPRNPSRTPSLSRPYSPVPRDYAAPLFPRKASVDSSMISRSQRDSAQSATPRASSTPGEDAYYNTESTRMLMDVELAIDPNLVQTAPDDASSRTRRRSTRPRLTDAANPFVDIDTILSIRGIRPLVLELLHSLGSYIDAVWCSRFPDLPCPWYHQEPATGTSWQSWVLGSVREAKARGLLANPPTAKDLIFWEDEVRYGLRDVDEAVNRRSNNGWVFAKAVMEGAYGDVEAQNVVEPSGEAGNVARLLNDLEEALWGDAVPIPTDIAYECDVDFDPFKVYRQGDQLVGVDNAPQPTAPLDASLSTAGAPLMRDWALTVLSPEAASAQVDMLALGRERHRLWLLSLQEHQ